MTPPRSVVWKYYEKKQDGTAMCRLCNKIIKTSGNTSNLMTHIKHIHKKIAARNDETSHKHFEKQTVNEKLNTRTRTTEIEKPTTSYSPVSAALANNVNFIDASASYSSNEDCSASTSTVWSPTSSVSNVSSLNVSVDVQGVELEQVHKRKQKTITDLFGDISAYTIGGSKNRKITNAIMYMICRDNQPFSLVENDGFIELMKATVPHYQIPSRQTITRMIDNKYEVLTKIFREKMLSVTNVTLTTDIWTETMQTRSFLGVTAHFKDGATLLSVTFGVYELDERHTAQYISEKLISVCKEWNIKSENVTAVVTDSGANIVKAVELAFDKKRHIPCLAHTINLVAERSLQSDPELIALLAKVKAIVTWFKRSVLASDELRKATDKETKLIQEVPTRWNSTLYMIQRFIELHANINNIVLRHVSAPPMVNAREVNELTEVMELLRPLEAVTKELSAEKFVTSSTVIPLVNCLIGQITRINPVNSIGIKLKQALENEHKRRFGQIENAQLLAISTLLDPRFKIIHFNDPLACSRVIRKLKDLQREYSTLYTSSSDSDQSGSTTGNEAFSLWSDHHRLVQQTWRKRSTEDTENVPCEEVTLYLRSPVGRLGDNPLQTWHEMAGTYPILSQIAPKYLSIVATSVPSERLFSKAGIIITQQRNRLKGHRLSKLLFLQSIEKCYWDI